MDITATLRECECDVSLNNMPRDLKRMLKVQFREFIHFIEDHENKVEYLDVPSLSKCKKATAKVA